MIELESALRARAEAAGQGHIFRFWDQLDSAGQQQLRSQVEAVDFELLGELAGLLQQPPASASDVDFQPPKLFPLDARQGSDADAARKRGEAKFRAGEVAYLLVAGGQASRLGYDGPKGDFPVGPVTGCTLFHLHAQRLLAAQARYGIATPWYVMTSPANHETTVAIFEREKFFGLKPDDVFFFSQAMLPALDSEGRIMMSAKDSLFLAPNGHGGVLAALATSGALDDMRKRGVDLISFFQVDNPLARPADELFVGLHLAEQAQMSTKVVAKRDAGEKVGVIGRVDGKLGCIEYSDLPADLREARDPESGDLIFRAGNIAVHLIDTAFVESLTAGGLKLPWHLAHKKMNVLDESGAIVSQPGVKFEAFVFDALSASRASVTLEVDRELEFSPVKNAEGEDSPATVRRDLCRLFAGWVQAAGLPLPPPAADGITPIEIAPTFAEDCETFVQRAAGNPAADDPRGHLYG